MDHTATAPPTSPSPGFPAQDQTARSPRWKSSSIGPSPARRIVIEDLAPPKRKPKPLPARAFTLRQIADLMVVEFPQWKKCFAELEEVQRTHPHEKISDQVSLIWRRHGFTGYPNVPKVQAEAIWVRMNQPDACTNAASVALGSFITRALAL